MTQGIDALNYSVNTIFDPQGGDASRHVTVKSGHATQEKCRDSLFPVSIFSKIAAGDQSAFQNLYR